MPRQAQPPTPPPSAELARADAVRGIRAVSTAPPGAHADRRRMRTRRAHARIGCASPPSEPPLAPTLCLYTLPPPSVCARHVPTRVARQVRRESTDVESLFIGHINGMDTMARGLRSAVKMMSDGTFDAMLHERCDLAPRSRSPAPAPHCPSGRARVHRVDAPVAHEACMAAGARSVVRERVAGRERERERVPRRVQACRYKGFSSGIGKKFADGKATLEDLAKVAAAEKSEKPPPSGRAVRAPGTLCTASQRTPSALGGGGRRWCLVDRVRSRAAGRCRRSVSSRSSTRSRTSESRSRARRAARAMRGGTSGGGRGGALA